MILEKKVSKDFVKPRKVLIVDDNPSCSMIAAHILYAEGCRVKTVSSGPKAIEAVRDEYYDLIVLDWKMPRWDGKKTLLLLDRFLRSRQADELYFVLHTGVNPKLIDLPYTKKIHLFGFWDKKKDVGNWHAEVRKILSRIDHGSGI